jgi:hypothetical protein
MTTSKKISNFKFNRVKVFWVDIQSHSEWISISDIEQHGTADCVDEGYLVEER